MSLIKVQSQQSICQGSSSRFFEDLRNRIDIHLSQKALDETNKEIFLQQHTQLIDKVNEFEGLCMSYLSEGVIESKRNNCCGKQRLKVVPAKMMRKYKYSRPNYSRA